MPITWRTTITPDLNPLLARFANADAVAWGNMRLAIRQSVNDLALLLAAASPRGRGESDGPRLADSWEVLDEGFVFRLRNTAPHLQYVLKGNDYPNQGGGSGWIYPTRGQFLRFTIDGETFFRRRVRATQPNDFVTPTIRAWRVTSKAILGTSLKTTARWLARG